MECDITGHMVLSHHVTVTVTRSYDAEKVIKGFRTDNIIQYSKSMLVLWITHGH